MARPSPIVRLVAAGGLAASALVAAMPPASAATIDVACSAEALVAAVETANAQAGGDTLSLTPGCTYSLTQRYGDTEDALPDITGGLIIDGNGARLERAEGALSFGIADIAGDLVVSNLTMAEFWGFNGAYFHVGGSLVMVDSTITNTPPIGQQSAALQVGTEGTLAVVGSTIENQNDIDGGTGGAIDNRNELVVVNSTFRNNRVQSFQVAPRVGGAIATSGSAKIFGSTFEGNTTSAVAGAVSNSGYLEIHDSSFTGNSANFGGAIRSAGASDLVVEDSYFGNNVAQVSGGAIDAGSPTLTRVTNSTFHRNRAVGGSGGALTSAHASRIEWSTFADNSAGSTGGTLHSFGGTVVVEASIVSGSSPCAGSVTDFGDNIVHPVAGSCPSGFTVGDPELLAPALRGGTTPTMSLGAGSAAFDHAGTTGCPATDQRGKPRPVGALCDAGASEDQLPTVPGTPTLTPASSNPNAGIFGLSWPAASDPDGQPLSYRLEHRDADDGSYSTVGTTTATSWQFTSGVPETEGTWRYRVIADDGNQASAPSPTSAPVVVDRSAPTTPLAATDRPEEYAADGGWWKAPVTVSFSGSRDPQLLDGSAGSGVAATTGPVTFTTSGVHTATGTATDHAGNVSAAGQLTVQVDAEAPTLGFDQCAADVVLDSDAVATWSASDPSSGLATAASGQFVLDTSTIGSFSMTATATDNVGHTAQATCAYRVVYDFDGFFKPLVNPPDAATFQAGDRIAVTFSLGGDQGLGVLAPGHPQSAPIACGSSPELTAGEPTRAVRPLQYGGGARQQYRYLWATDPAWAGTCRQLVVLLDDGTHHRANVSFLP